MPDNKNAWMRTIFPESDSTNIAENAKLEMVNNAESTFYTGVDNLFKMGLDPMITGYAFIYWIDLPGWFDEDGDLKYFKQLSQKNFLGFTGLSDINLNTTDLVTGFNAASYSVPAGISVGNTEFTLTHKEYSGAVMGKMYSKWLNMLRDSRTGIALYPHAYKDDNGAPKYEYSRKNEVGKFLYVVVRPDIKGVNSLENAFLWLNVFPTNVPLDHYNYSPGQNEAPTINVSFKGKLETGPDVLTMAKTFLSDRILYNGTSNEGIRIVDSMDIFDTNATCRPFNQMIVGGADNKNAGKGEITKDAGTGGPKKTN